jgi:subtilisin family serine protease
LSRLSAALFLLLAAPAAAFETMRVMVPASGGTSGSAVTGATVSVEVAKSVALVRVSSGAGAGLAAAVAAGGGSMGADLGSGWWSVTLPPGMNAPQGLPWLQALPDVVQVQYDHVFRPNLSVNDPLAGSQFGLDQINARQAWDYETGTSARVTIAIIDAGVEKTHVDLSSAMANTGAGNRSFAVGTGAEAADDPPDTECNHATRVAGIAAARGNNGVQMAGVAFGGGIQLVSYRVFNNGTCTPECGGGGCVTDDAAIIAAINRARTTDAGTAAFGRMVLNLSLGGAQACGAALQTAVTNAVNAGIVLVAASGNDAGPVNSPGNCSGVIPVGATDASGAIASFSSRGPELASGGLVAPGAGVLTTTLSNGTVSGINGTSFAAPHVAGVAALILAAKPAYTVAQVQAALRGSSDPVGFGTQGDAPYYKTQGNSSGAGRLNAFLAMQLAIKGQLADFQGEDKVVAFPNPFRADRHQNVTFAFPPSIQNASDVTIKIYTQDGALVRDLNSLTWNTKNDQGRFVASGTYVFVVSTSRGKRSGRVSVLR